jgi:hypothetical protein
MSFSSVMSLAQVNADLDDPTTSVLATMSRRHLEACKFAETMVLEVSKNLNCFSTEVEGTFQGGDATQGRLDIGINDLRYDGPLKMMLPLQDIYIPAWLDGGDEFSPFGYDFVFSPRRTGHYSLGVHSSKEMYEKLLVERALAQEEALAAMEEGSMRGSEVSRLSSSMSSETALEATVAMVGAGDDKEEEEDLLEEYESLFESLVWEELEDPTVDPIIELLIGKIDLEVYVDPLSVEQQQQAQQRSRPSFTEEHSLWQHGWEEVDHPDRRIGLQVGVGVEDQEPDEDDEGAWTGSGRVDGEFGGGLGRALDISVATGTSAGTRFRLSSLSVGTRTERVYTHAVKLLFMSLEGDETTSDTVVANLRELLSRIWGYLKKDTLSVIFNVMATLDVLPDTSGLANVCVRIDPVTAADETADEEAAEGGGEGGERGARGESGVKFNGPKDIVAVSLEFNLVTLVDDIISSVQNISVW